MASDRVTHNPGNLRPNSGAGGSPPEAQDKKALEKSASDATVKKLFTSTPVTNETCLHRKTGDFTKDDMSRIKRWVKKQKFQMFVNDKTFVVLCNADPIKWIVPPPEK